MEVEQDEVVRSLTEMLALVKLAMPEYLFKIDPRVHRARQLIASRSQVSESRPPSILAEPLEMLDLAPTPTIEDVDRMAGATSPWDITTALDALMAEPLAPASRTEAVIEILRDWFIAHGYLASEPPEEEQH